MIPIVKNIHEIKTQGRVTLAQSLSNFLLNKPANANWCILLSIIAFAMSMVGTFIVRSGLITSVHAFATDPNRGIFILTLISIYIVASLSIFALRPIKADGFLKYSKCRSHQ